MTPSLRYICLWLSKDICCLFACGKIFASELHKDFCWTTTRSNFIETGRVENWLTSPPFDTSRKKTTHLVMMTMAMGSIMRINMKLIGWGNEGITTYFLTGLDMKAKGTTPWLLSDTVTCWFSFIFCRHRHHCDCHHHHHHIRLAILAYHKLNHWTLRIMLI